MDTAQRPTNTVYWLATAAALCGVTWTMRDTFASMAEIWLTSSNFNHCLFVLPASAILVWRRRHRLAQIPARPSVVGILAFAGCAALWGLGALGNVATLQNLAFVAMIPTAIWAVSGYATTREMAFPLVFLFFMVPFGEFVMPWLMDLTAGLTVLAVRASGVSVYKDGLFFVIPNGSFKIVEACSGIRMLIASLAVGVLFAHLAFVSWARRVSFVLAMIAMSLCANGIRAYAVVMIAHYTGMETIANHLMFGYVVFAIVILLMLVIGSRFADFDEAAFRKPLPPVAVTPRPAWEGVVAGTCIVLLVLGAPRAVAAIEAQAAEHSTPPPMLLPVARGDWSGPDAARPDWKPDFVGGDARLSGLYRRGAVLADVWIVNYDRQEQGREVINARNRLFDTGRFTLLRQQIAGAVETERGPVPYNELELRGPNGARRLVRFWYVVDGRPTQRPLEIKLRELRNAVLGRPTPATVVAVSTTFHDGPDASRAVLDDFVSQVYVTAYPPNGAIE